MTKRVVAVIFVLALVLMAGLVAGCGGESGLPNDAVAQVGSEYISQEEFDARLAMFESQYAGSIPDKETDPEAYKEFQQQVLDYMVMHEVVVQKSESLGISVSDAEVQTEFDSILNDSFGGDQAQFDEALKAQGVTLEQLKVNYKESMLLQKAYDQVTKDVTTVPEADIAAYFEEHKAEYFTDETRTARHILISPTGDRPTTTTTTTATSSSDSSTTTIASTTTTAPPTDAEWAAALATAEKVRADLAGGADWTEEAQEYSDDPGTKEVGGDLGTVYKGQMVPEFEESVYSMAVDEISEPVKTSYGYHIIQVTAITEAKQYTLDDESVKSDITTTLVNEAKGKVWTDWLTTTKAELKVVYKEGMELPTTTTTAVSGETTTTVGSNDTSTTDTAATTSSTAGNTITTAAPETTTTSD